MPEESFQEKTEPATPRRRREAREKGNIPRSNEVNSTVVLLAGMAALYFFGKTMSHKLVYAMKWIFARLSVLEFSPTNVPEFALAGLKFLGSLLSPVVFTVMIAGVGACIFQGGFVFAGEPLMPKLSKINPLSGLKRMFSVKSILEIVKGLLKILIVGAVGYSVFRGELKAFPFLIDWDVSQIVAFVGHVGLKLGLRIGLVLMILAGFDFAYQKMDFEKRLRMTRQEVKEEFKRAEGDPLIKARIRSVQRERARMRMLSEVPKADVVITNPVHLAVALKYDPSKTSAPVVVAKGARLIAEKIKEIALAHSVPIVENRPLARLLYRTTDIGSEIPYELYKAVAEVLAYVYRLKGKGAR